MHLEIQVVSTSDDSDNSRDKLSQNYVIQIIHAILL